jgi:LysM repeat protein
VRSGIRNFTKEPAERQIARACQKKPLMPESRAMKRVAISLSALLVAVGFGYSVNAQTPAGSPASSAEVEQLQALAKKIDEQNAKIDTLSQQILKLEQQIANMRPGVIVGEATPAPTAMSEVSARPGNGNTHTVARGETLTSIAKMHGVTVSELQKVNHIENDRKLQIGQTIMIPIAATPTPSSSPGQ